MNHPHILVAEDEASIREVQTAYLREAGYAVTEAADGLAALEFFVKQGADLVVIDINLPGLDGLELCRRLRETSLVPIIMVTARVQDNDELTGLENGADDYIKKPFNPRVLVARVNALLKRHHTGLIRYHEFELDAKAQTLTIAGRPVRLTATQFNLLLTLARHPGRVFTRQQLIDAVYADPAGHDIYDRTIDAHIKNLRQALQSHHATPCIKTIIGSGYAFYPESDHA